MSQTEEAKPSKDSIRIRKAKFPIDSIREKELLSRLIHKIGHEIGNPLTSIISLATIIERFSNAPGQSPGLGNEKLVSYAGSIIDEAWRVSSITENLVLLLSQRQGSPTACDLGDSIERALAKLSSRKKLDSSIVKVFISEETSPSAYIDSDQLLALLCELIGNAAQALNYQEAQSDSPPPPISYDSPPISIKVSCSEARTIIEVSSLSSSSCPLELSSLFEPLVSSHEAHKHVGLGLTAAVAIVERAQGEIEVSEEKKGSSYCFTTRVSLSRGESLSTTELEGDASANTKQAMTNLVQKGSFILPPNLTVFIVEDEPSVASAMGKILEVAFGKQTNLHCHFLSGMDAITALKNNEHFDVILCDLNLAGLSGRHVLETLLSQAPEKKNRFAFLTGEKARPETQLYLKSSGRVFLHKPFEPNELIRLVVSLLSAS